jgi:hypothetical protein
MQNEFRRSISHRIAMLVLLTGIPASGNVLTQVVTLTPTGTGSVTNGMW